MTSIIVSQLYDGNFSLLNFTLKRAQRLLADAKGIGNPGPVLVQQINDLGRALRQSIYHYG